jgi:hypothetical protein
MRPHALRYFCYVRNDIGTKPHGIRRAGVTRLWTALRGGQAYSRNPNPDDHKTDRQDRSANKMHEAQHIFASFPTNDAGVLPRFAGVYPVIA